jgi:hypothetical protein
MHTIKIHTVLSVCLLAVMFSALNSVYAQTNVALGKTGTASSTQAAGYEASKAFDGITTSRWSSNASDPQWVYVDLSTSYRINHITISWETASAKNYTIEVATNVNGPWRTVYTQRDMTAGARTDDMTITTVLARYVRLTGLQRCNTAWGYSMYEMAVYGDPVTTENIMVMADAAMYSAIKSKIDTYVQNLKNEGFNVTLQTWTHSTAATMVQCRQLYSLLYQSYYSQQINGAVLIGDIPYAEYRFYGDPRWPYGKLIVDDYYFMDLVNCNNKYDAGYHDRVWPSNDWELSDPVLSECDNHCEIWVSRITATNIITAELKDVNGATATQLNLVSQYFDRLNARMTQQESIPPRAISMTNTLPDYFYESWNCFSGYNNFFLNGSNQPLGSNPLAFNPANWQAQLQAGPYGKVTGSDNKLKSNAWPVLSLDSKTYPALINDTYGYEWGGILVDSDPGMHWFANVSAGNFYSTDVGAKAYDQGNALPTSPTRTYTSMYLDGGHPKTRFYMDMGCDNASINEPDCMGQLYAIAGNGLITIGNTATGHETTGESSIFPILYNDTTRSFGSAFQEVINTRGMFPVSQDVMICLGAGTLKPRAAKGYSRKYINADYSLSVTSNNEAANSCSGTLSFTSNSPNGSGYNAASTSYSLYDPDRKLLLTVSPSTTYDYTINADNSTVLHIGNVTIDPLKKYFVSACQSGFASAFIGLNPDVITGNIPKIYSVSPSILSVTTTATNWWIDDISGQLQCFSTSNKLNYDNKKTSFKWYDKAGTLQTTLTGATSYTYRFSLDRLTVNGKAFTGSATINGLQAGYFMAKYRDFSTYYVIPTIETFNVSGIYNRSLFQTAKASTFTPVVNATNSTLEIAGTNGNGYFGDDDCLVGEVLIGGKNTEITAKPIRMLATGSANQKIGLVYHRGSADRFYTLLFQNQKGSIIIRKMLSYNGDWSDVTAPGSYTLGSTWLKLKAENGTVTFYASKDGTNFTSLGNCAMGQTGTPCYGGVMYSSAGSAGSGRLEYINIKKY